MRKNDIRKNMKDKTTELVQYVYLNKEDRKVRNLCRRKYGKEVEQFGECEQKHEMTSLNRTEGIVFDIFKS